MDLIDDLRSFTTRMDLLGEGRMHLPSLGKGGCMVVPIDNSHYRLISKLGKEMQINHHS